MKGPAQDYTIKLSGTNDLVILGAMNVDGTTKQITTELPAEFQVRASTLVCYFQKQTDDGQLELQISRNQSPLGSSVAKGPIHGVRAELDNNLSLFTCF